MLKIVEIENGYFEENEYEHKTLQNNNGEQTKSFYAMLIHVLFENVHDFDFISCRKF